YDATPGVASWLDRFWETRYLGRRDRIALNANFFFLFQPPARPAGQLERAAGLVAAAVAYKQLIDREEVPPVVVRGQPTTMTQHRFLFATTRIPGDVQDTARTPYSDEA